MWTSAMPGILASSRRSSLATARLPARVDAHHLHVDRGRQAEVEDLAGDVGRLEVEDAVGEPLRQLLPQPGDVVGRRRVLLLEGDQDLAVGVADRAVIDVGPHGERRRQPHVVEDQLPLVRGHDLADHVLDLAEDPLGLLDAGARRRPDVQPELAGVDGREEVVAEPAGPGPASPTAKPSSDDQRHGPVRQAPAQQPLRRPPGAARTGG